LQLFVYSGIMHVMARETWTDQRLDDLAKRMDAGFSEVKEELRSNRAELKGEIAATRAELKGDIDALSRKFDRLTITLIAALFGMVITRYLG